MVEGTTKVVVNKVKAVVTPKTTQDAKATIKPEMIAAPDSKATI